MFYIFRLWFCVAIPKDRSYWYKTEKQQEFFEGNMQVLSSNGLEIFLRCFRFVPAQLRSFGIATQNQRRKLCKHSPDTADKSRSSFSVVGR